MEGFVPCPYVPDRYLINKDGDVYSLKREKFISKRLDRYGYVRVNLYKDSKNKTVTVHRLIALAFIPNPYNLPEVNHIDGDKTNYKISNLEWVTGSENQLHAFETGLQVGKHGETNPKATHTEEDVHIVCKLLKEGYTNKLIHNTTGYTYSFIEKIKYGDCWTYITEKYGIIPKTKRATTIEKQLYS